MLFNSYEFTFGFLPLLILAYYLTSQSRWQRETPWLLAVASLIFYAWWNPAFLPLFLFSVGFNYSWALLLRRSGAEPGAQSQRRRKLVLAVGVAVNLSLLFYFKYRDFFVSSVDVALGVHWPLLHMALPLAISFFTFEQITYLVSSYREEEGTHDFVSYLMFITFFPHLIAGPIVRYREIYPQFNRNSRFGLDASNVAAGLMIFAIGLFKKVIIADTFRGYVEPIYDAKFAPAFYDAWGSSLAFGLQIYFDFSGYSDMAIGLARMFNVRFPENFDSPYQSTSLIEFWRRWHITLSFFLRDYLYIPLGGNRRGELRRYLNVFITFLLGGLWHGANWTFVIWGALHGGFLAVNHAWRKVGVVLPSLACWALTFFMVTIAWVFFRAVTLGRAMTMLAGMAGLNGFAWNLRHESLGWHEMLRIAGGLGLVWLAPNRQTIMEWDWGSDWVYAGALAVMVGVCLLCMANPPAFIYFQF